MRKLSISKMERSQSSDKSGCSSPQDSGPASTAGSAAGTTGGSAAKHEQRKTSKFSALKASNLTIHLTLVFCLCVGDWDSDGLAYDGGRLHSMS
jgi:hypothetical protein